MRSLVRALPAVALACSGLPQAALRAQAGAFGPADALVADACLDCHDGGRRKGGLDLAGAAGGSTIDWLRTLSRVRDRVAAGEMPPPDDGDLSVEERRLLVEFCSTVLRAEVPRLRAEVPPVTVRRLSRAEWDHCVLDLLGVRSRASAAFPADDLAYGFDNIGDALSFSTLHLEKYLVAAADVARQVYHGENHAAPAVRRLEAERMALVAGPGVDQDGEIAGLYTNATIEAAVTLPRDGIYRLRIRAGADQAGDEPARMAVRVDGRDVAQVEVPQRPMRAFELSARLGEGRRRVAVAFTNDYFRPEHEDPKRRDRNLRVDWLEVEGPVDRRPEVAQQAWLRALPLPADGADGADAAGAWGPLAAAIVERLHRVPATDDAVRTLVGVAERALQQGAPAHLAARQLLTAALSSPRFLFRFETGTPGAQAAVTAPQLAVRLSFFLWSSAPDDELRQLAWSGELRRPEVLERQVLRLLADPRAERLATNFAGQWLELRALEACAPDPARFPGFDDELRDALRRESESLFAAVLREHLDVRTLLSADFTFVDARLARFYGLDGDFDGWQRVSLPPELRARGGVLGHASVLAVTSNPTRTSPVKRGKWILENLLDQAPPPPPPGNDSLPDESRADTPVGLRRQMELHRSEPVCASCHRRMDALGLALERFDAVGRPRAQDDGAPIDDHGELPDGRRLDGLPGLKAALLSDPAFPRALLRKLFVYAVGRQPGPVERLQLDERVDLLAAAGSITLADLIRIVVHSDGFRGP